MMVVELGTPILLCLHTATITQATGSSARGSFEKMVFQYDQFERLSMKIWTNILTTLQAKRRFLPNILQRRGRKRYLLSIVF